MMKKIVLLLCVALMVQGAAQAANRYWVGAPAGADWGDTANWSDVAGGASGFSVPTNADMVYFSPKDVDWVGVDTTSAMAATQTSKSYYAWTNQIMNITGAAEVKNFRFANSTSFGRTASLVNATVNLQTGASLNVTGEFAFRYNYDAVVFNQAAGTTVTLAKFNPATQAYRYVYNMYGGTLTVTGASGLTLGSNCGWAMTANLGDISYDDNNDSVVETHVNVSGEQPLIYGKSKMNVFAGTITTPALVFQGTTTSKGVLNLQGGKIKVLGNVTATGTNAMEGWLYFGNIIADNGAGVVSATYDSGTGYTTIVPEPATMMLLGLGSMCLIRRKK